MKQIFLTIMLMALWPQSSSGFSQEGIRNLKENADGAGNGGGTWVCQNKDQLQTIRWVRLVDLYEAEKEFLLSLRTFGNRDYKEIVEFMKVTLFSINKNLYERLLPYFEEVEEKIREVDADLEIIDDALYRVRPPARDCQEGTIKYIQLANFTHYGTILINKHLFNNSRFEEIDKASLIFHEVIYAFLRDRYGDTNSVRTRKIVGYVFSTLKPKEIREKIDSVLGYVSGGIAGLKFASIDGGSFIMGSPENEPGRDNDEKQRSVTITYNYEMMVTEVTQAMYFEVMGKNPSYFKNQTDCPLSFETRVMTNNDIESLCPDNPVETVSFNDVINFIALLNAQTGINYRLPTEAEWEYAARAGNQAAYSFGDSVTFLWENGIYNVNSESKTHPVGPMRNHANNPNHNGLYDMHGNVWEWTQDRYTKSPSGSVNPEGPTTGLSRVYRGGSWLNFAGFLRSASRDYLPPSPRLNSVGFRLVR